MTRLFKVKYLLAVLAASLLWSCDSYIDELGPENDVSPDQIADEATVDAALNGAYSNLTEAAYSRAVIISSFQEPEELNFAGSFTTFQDIQAGQIFADNGSIAALYSEPYQLINRANTVLKVLPDITLSPATAAQFDAECRLARAWGHFFLLIHFGDRALLGSSFDANPGVPIILDPFEDVADVPSFQKARNTNDEVWDFIISELTAIRANLTANPASAGSRIATTGAADALLARCYLYRRDYANAAASANNVINSGFYALTGTLENTDVNTYTSGNTEWVWGADLGTLNNPGVNDAVGSFFQSQTEGGRGDQRINVGSGVTALYSGTDSRGTLYETLSGITFTTKWNDPVTNADDIPFIRYSDVLLMRAEALTRSSGTVGTEAVGLLNQVAGARDASFTNFTTGDFANATALIDRILEERRKELAHEGVWKFDLIRTGQGLKNIAAGSTRLVFPIPVTARDQNPNLAQNPGY